MPGVSRAEATTTGPADPPFTAPGCARLATAGPVLPDLAAVELAPSSPDLANSGDIEVTFRSGV
jgi:hypothetical protein